MRAAFGILGLLLLTGPRAMAQPPAIVLPDSPLADRSTPRVPFPDSPVQQDILAGRHNAASDARLDSPSPLSLGPFSMDIGSVDTGKDGKIAHFAHVHLENFHVLGGNVSGTFDGRAATLRLSWPTGVTGR